MLKGYLSYHHKEIKKTHDLTLLYKDCAGVNHFFSEIESECVNLTDFSVNIRYPYSLEINELDMIQAIKDAECVMTCILNMDK
jgi:hypothetical protein